MEDIKVGEYCRTKQGDIFKFVETNMFRNSILKDIKGASYDKEDIVKHSKNIIDLIEEGDYVNGYKVDFVQNNEAVFNHNHPRQINIFTEEIKSVVTKELFNSVKYEVEK